MLQIVIYWLFVIPVSSFIMFGVFTILSFRQFDKVLRAIYARSKDEWIRLGRPIGMFWVPRDASTLSLSSSFSRGNLFQNLSTNVRTGIELTDEMKADVEQMQTLRKHGIRSLLLGFGSFALIFLASVLLQMG